MKPQYSLRIKIIASFAAVLFAAVTIITLYTYNNTRQVLTQREIEAMQQELRAISDKTNAYLDRIKQIAAFTYEDNVQVLLDRAPEETRIQEMLRLISFGEFYYKRLASLNVERELQDIYFIYPDAEVLHKGSGIYDPAYDFTRTDWYAQAVKARGRGVLIETHQQAYNIPGRYDTREGVACLGVAMAVMRLNADKLLGVLMMDLKLDEISHMLEPLLLGHNSRVFFVSDAGRVLYDTTGETMLGQSLPEHIRQGLSGESGSFFANLDQEDMTVTYLKSEATGWWMVNLNQTALIVEDIVDQQRNVLLVALMAFIATAVLGIVFSRRIVRPLEEMTNALDRVSTGELDVQLPVGSRDEIGRLSTAFNAMSRRLRSLISENYLIRLREREAQIETLQSQINPHFLYNTLESISCIAQVNEVQEISVISRSLARMLRHSFREGHSFVRVRDELDNVTNYMNIQKIRYGHRIELQTEVKQEVMDCPIIRMALQPLVENVIHHAVENSKTPITVRITARKEGDCTVLGVWDNGPGLSPERLEQLQAQLAQPIRFDRGGARRHIGLNNLNSRLKLHYGEEYGLQVHSEEGVYTHVNFRVPAKQALNNECEINTHIC